MPSFRRDLARCLSPSASPSPSRTDFYSPMLHNAILALACSLYRGPRIVKPFPPINPNAPALQLFPQGPSTFFSESEQSTLDSSELAGLAFYNQARASLESECENPMLSSVRALICFASFQSNLARCNLGVRALPFPCPFSLSLLLSSFLVSLIIAKNLSSLLLTDLITLSTVPLLRVRVFNCLLPSFPRILTFPLRSLPASPFVAQRLSASTSLQTASSSRASSLMRFVSQGTQSSTPFSSRIRFVVLFSLFFPPVLIDTCHSFGRWRSGASLHIETKTTRSRFLRSTPPSTLNLGSFRRFGNTPILPLKTARLLAISSRTATWPA